MQRPVPAGDAALQPDFAAARLPLQATLFTLTQTAAQHLAAEQITAAGLRRLQTRPRPSCTTRSCTARSPTRTWPASTREQRAVLVMERNKTALVFDPQRTAEELLAEAAARRR